MQQPRINITVTHAKYGQPLIAVNSRTENEATRGVYDLFRMYPDVFPHIRYDYVRRAIFKTGGTVIVSDGKQLLGALIYKVYKRPHGLALQGDVLICQIVSRNQRQGIGSMMMGYLPTGVNLLTTVRESNTEARSFYEKHGFVSMKRTSWKGGTIPGLVYRQKSGSYLSDCC